MRSSENEGMLGVGVYTLREASLYGGISSRKLSRWALGTSQYPSVLDSQLQVHRLISFYDLVQAMAVDRARARGISLHKIRLAIERAQEDYRIDLPLAYKHILYFDGGLHIRLGEDAIVELTGPVRGQSMMQKIMEPFMKCLCFDNQTGLVQTYTPFEKFGRKIVLNPNRQFGQPIVEGTGYRADVLANAYRIEGTVESVKEEFNVESEDVRLAVDYMHSLGKAA